MEIVTEYSMVNTDDEIVNYCKESKIIAIDSPLTFTKGFRNVDKEMKRRGYRVLPPSFMESLVKRAIKLSDIISKVTSSKIIETHPTSSMKKLGIDWKTFTNVKDEIDAVICALVAYSYDLGLAEKISANDGEIYLLPKNLFIEKKGSVYLARIT